MGQIVGGAAKPKRCNLNKLSQLETPAAGEFILVSSDNSMNAVGQGNFDCYIEGDGQKAATALELKNVETFIGVFDISSYHATGGVLAKYADLTAALDDGNNIPQPFRKGGMSVKFVLSSDNKYVQARCMAQNFTTDITQWQGVDDEPVAGSHNLVESAGVSKFIKGPIVSFGLRNGSQGNAGNTWVITVKGSGGYNDAIPVISGHKYKFIINKTPQSGYNFYFRIVTYNTATPTNLVSNAVRNQVNNWNNYYENGGIIQINEGELGLSIQLTELTSPGVSQAVGSCIPLRVADFTTGDLELHDISEGVSLYGVENRVSALEPAMVKTLSFERKLLNNSFIGNNNTFVSKDIIGLQPGRRYRIVLTNPNYDKSGITATSVYIFQVASYVGTTQTILDGAVGSSSTTLPSYYEFQVPSSSEKICIGGRATQGVSVDFYIYDITQEDENKDSAYQNTSPTSAYFLNEIFYVEEQYGGSIYLKVVNEGVTLRTVTSGYISTAATTTIIANDLGKSLETSPKGVDNCVAIDSGKSLLFDANNKVFVLKNIGEEYDVWRYIFVLSSVNGKIINYGQLTCTDVIRKIRIRSEAALASLSNKILRWRNGSPGNASNTNLITSCAMPYNGQKYISVEISRPNTPGYQYVYGFFMGNSIESIGRTITLGTQPTGGSVESIGDLSLTSYSNIKEISAGRRNWESVGVCIGESDGTNFNPLRVSDILQYRVTLKMYDNSDITETIVTRNADKLPMLTSSCRFRKSSDTSKDFQIIIATDSHGDNKCVENSVVAVNGFSKIDTLVHCGDAITNFMHIGENVDALWKNIIAFASKPCYFVMGNHEKGTYPAIYCSPTDEELYNAFIKPIVDKGWLVSGEYTVNKCYWYHDFATRKIRLIALDEYETPRIIDETYWEPITYNSSLQSYGAMYGTSFSQGDEINVTGYTEHSFRAKQNISSAQFYEFTSPSYKYRIGYRWISQAQAEWFLDKLATTPSGYQVIVACHNPFSDHADVDQTRMFSQKNGWVNGHGMQNYMTNDFIADAINAFQNKTNFSTTCSSQYPTDMPSYNVSKDFSSVVGTFHSLIGGHVHQDCVWKHQTYNQYQITPICTNSIYYGQCPTADIRRSSSASSDTVDVDCLTVLSFGEGRIGLVKLGVNVTEVGTRRDYEVIDISE